MPRRKVTRKKFTEDDERAQKLETLLKQFDMEVDRRVYEMHRATEQACAHIDSMFKLARLKIPSAVREEFWEASKQAPAAVDSTLSAVDAVLSEAGRSAQQQKPARGRGRTRATPSAAALVTPLQPPMPLHSSTPAVTPKFDPRTVQRQPPSTLRRHRPREVLMSLKGSPVMPDHAPATAAAGITEAERKRLMQQTTEALRQDSQDNDPDEETIQLMATLRDQLINLTTNANAAI